MTKTVAIALTTLMVGLIFSGCVIHDLLGSCKKINVQDQIARNNENRNNLKIGITPEQVQQIMGKPDNSEAYAWGTAWVYRTAMTSGVDGKANSDFTPIVFDENGNLIGWGRDFLLNTLTQKENDQKE